MSTVKVNFSDRSDRRAGAGLVVVLIIGVVIAGIVGITTFLATNGSVANAEWDRIVSETVECESVAELMRAEVVADFEASKLPTGIWLEEVRSGQRFGSDDVRSFPAFPDVQAWVDEVSPVGEGSLWVEVVGATVLGTTRGGQSVRKRLHFGVAGVMEFAILTKTVNCMFCHVNVTGDVGSLGRFRPGWSANNSGVGKIFGDLYVAADAVEGTGSYRDTLNGVEFDGDLHEYYVGPKLPEDTNEDGEPDFPAIDPAVARERAGGGVWSGGSTNQAGDGSGVWVTPLLGSWDPDGPALSTPPAGATGSTWRPANSDALGSVVEGNLTIVGTKDHPIQLNGDVYVTGDVVLKGYVSGQGAVYSGRNIYLAGDVVYSDGPDAMANDQDAITAIKSRKDELRLAARSNIVLGDWTYMNADGTLQGMRDRQAQSFISSAHDLDEVRYYKASDEQESSIELTKVNEKFFDDLGNEVASSDVISVDSTNSMGPSSGTRVYPERYDSVIAPGQVQADGSFNQWLSQEQFRDILGTKNYDDMMWRASLPNDSTIVDKELGAGWSSKLSGAGRDAVYDHDFYGEPGLGQYVSKSGSLTQVIETGSKPWPTAVERVDAFLYSNRRISGLTPMVAGLTVNGGLVAREIQLLAPGLGNHMNWFKKPTRGDVADFPAMAWQQSGTTSQHGDAQDAFYVNYDYRLRNGGMGFNLIPTNTGDAILAVRGGKEVPPEKSEGSPTEEPVDGSRSDNSGPGSDSSGSDSGSDNSGPGNAEETTTTL